MARPQSPRSFDRSRREALPPRAVAAKRMGKQGVRCAVELRRGYDVAAAVRQRQKGVGECCLSRCDGERRGSALKLGDPLFQDTRGWAADTTVAVP